MQDDRGKRERSPSLAASKPSLQTKRMKVAEPDIQGRLGGRPPPRKRNPRSTLSLAEHISGPSAASASMPAHVQVMTLLSKICGHDSTAAMSSRPSFSTHESRMSDVSVEPSGSRPPLKSAAIGRGGLSGLNQQELSVRVVYTDIMSMDVVVVARRTHLMATSHLAVISRSSHTVHHSSSTLSPTRIRPSSIQLPVTSGFAMTLTSNGSLCHRK